MRQRVFVFMLLILFFAVVGCTKSNVGKPYTEDDIIGLLQSTGLTIVERDPITEDPEFGAQMVSLKVRAGDQEAPILVWLFSSPEKAQLERLAPGLVSVSSQKAQERIYQAHTAVLLVLSMDDALLASVKKAIPVTKAYHAQK